MIFRFTRKLVHGFALVASLIPASATYAAAGSATDEALIVDGQERRFLVHNFSNTTAKVPLVIVLHGGGGSGENAALQTGFDTVAEREHLIAVYPYGNGRFGDILLTWNAGHCCSYAMEQNIDDVNFIDKLIDDLVARYNVDPMRVYVTGLSNGGMMSHRIGIELGHKVAAIAPVIASVFGDEPVRETAVPTLIINGADDQTVRINGGELGGIAGTLGGSDGPLKPVSEQGAYWAKVNGCGPMISLTTATYQKFTYACGEGKAVERYLVTGNGHAWPGGTAPRSQADPPVQTFSANDVIWDFFKRFKRDAVPLATLEPYYFDGNLNIPALTAPGKQYSAQLQLTRALPAMEFQLTRAMLQAVTGGTGLPSYSAGTLLLPAVRVGGKRYTARLSLLQAAPMIFRAESITALP